MSNVAYVYWIHKKEDTDIFTQGYVGVTRNTKVRWKRHEKETKNNVHDNLYFANVVQKTGWDNLIKEIVIVANEDYCYEIENKLRKEEKIGWNLCPGGMKPPVSKPRGKNYISPLKGVPRPTPWLIGTKKSAEERQKIKERRQVKVKYQNVTYDSFFDLAEFLNIKYSTLTNRIYRNPKKWGYEVIK